jgi:hypothetical protein
MFDAQLLFPGSSPATGIKVYSPWFPRQGDSLRATAEMVHVNGATLKVTVFTKNPEDTGDGTNADAGTTITLAAAGRSTAEWTSGTATLKELVRYRFEVTGTLVSDWVLFRMLAPVWFDTAKA